MPFSKDKFLCRLHQKYITALEKYQANPTPYLCDAMLKAKKKLNEHLKLELKNLKTKNAIHANTTTHP